MHTRNQAVTSSQVFHAKSASPPASSKPVARLSIVSNSQLLREGLATLLTNQLDLPVRASYGAEAALAAVADGPEELILLDGNLGASLLIRLTRHWRSATATNRVIIVELANDTDLVLECIEAGASGYTLQGAGVVEVASVIRQVRAGQVVCSPEVTAQLFERLATYRATSLPRPDTTPELLLTPRELEILRLVAADYSNQQIADQLVIGICTVKHHVHNILEKLKLRHRWDAARFAAEQGWFDNLSQA